MSTTGTGKTFRLDHVREVETSLEDCIDALLAPAWHANNGKLKTVVSAKIGVDILWHLRNYRFLLEQVE